MKKPLAGMRIMVTGAAGFKGAWLSALAAELGARVTGLVYGAVAPDGAFSLLRLGAKITSAEVDVRSAPEVRRVVNAFRPDLVFHLAAMSVVPACADAPIDAFTTNVLGTVNVLEACRLSRAPRVSRVVLCSSDHVFGTVPRASLPVREDHPRRPLGVYDTSKLMAELAARAMVASGLCPGIDVVVVRSANNVGLGDSKARRVVPEFVRKALAGGRIRVDDARVGRQFVAVEDCVSGYLAAGLVPRERLLKAKLAGIPTFHFGLSRHGPINRPYITIGELAVLVQRAAGVPASRADTGRVSAQGENLLQALDTSRTRATLNWTTRKPLDKALAAAVAFERAEPRQRARLCAAALATAAAHMRRWHRETAD